MFLTATFSIFLAESFSACMETDAKILLDFNSFVMFFQNALNFKNNGQL